MENYTKNISKKEKVKLKHLYDISFDHLYYYRSKYSADFK